MKSKPLTKQRLKPQRPKIRRAIKFRLSILIGAIVLIGATAPIWHIWFDVNSTYKIFGFSNIHVFLYAFGSHFAIFCAASFIFWIKNFIDPQYKNLPKIINIVGGVFAAVGSYLLIWVFNPYSDFPEYVYHIVFGISAVFIAYGMYALNNFIFLVTLDKKRNIKNLISFIIRIRNKHYRRVAVKALHAEEYKEPLQTEDTVEDNANEFEEDFYETLEKVDTLRS